MLKKISVFALIALLFAISAFATPEMVGVENADEITQEAAKEETASLAAYTEGYYTYTVTDGVATITDCDTSISGDVVIPANLGGYPVTSIGNDAFYNCTSLESVEIPDSVTSIGMYAFYSCKSLENITFGDNSQLTSIGFQAFYNCTSLESIEIPDSVTSIGMYAFYSCKSLESVTFGDNSQLTSIDSQAFYYCTSLTSLEIPDSVTSIESHAFSHCTSLESVTFGEDSKLTIIGDYVFYNCASLENITIPDSVLNICDFAFYSCENLAYIEIPDRVTSIGERAFYECKSLKNITFPDSVTSVGDSAFAWCTSLDNIIFGDNSMLASIGSSAFAFCTNLKSVTFGDSAHFSSIVSNVFYSCDSLANIRIPNGVKRIEYHAFYSCDSLLSVEIPDSVTSIVGDAFEGCTRLSAIYYAGTLEQWNSISIGSGNSYLTNAVVTDNKYKIIYNANNGEAAPEIQYPTRGETTNLSLGIPVREGYEFLGWSTAKDGEVEYAPGAEYLGKENIELFAVWTCNAQGNCGFNLKWKMYGTKLTITGTGSMTNWSESSTVPWSEYKNEIETIVISDGATSIGSYAFSDCENLKTVTFTESVTKINSHAFYNASSIETINFTGSLGDLESIEISGYNDSFMNGSFNFDYVITYTITYNTLGGMSDIQEQSKKHGEPITLSTELPKKIGYKFLGWSVEQGGEIVYNAGDEYTENADIVLYAVWEEVMGDASGDGEITNEDITIVADAIFGKTLTEEEFKYANVYDEDNEINVKDLIKLAQMMSQNK